MSPAGAGRADSDSNDVGQMSPVEESRRTWPPEEPWRAGVAV